MPGGFSATLDATGWPDHPTAVDRLLLDCARELLTNVVKHANARTVTVTLASTARGATLVVKDDGDGMDPALRDDRLKAGHVGLATRRIRVEAAGGVMLIVSVRGEGTRVTVILPLA